MQNKIIMLLYFKYSVIGQNCQLLIMGKWVEGRQLRNLTGEVVVY